MTGELFGRSARLLVGDLDVSGLRFGFEVEKHLRKEPNTARISVWNLSEEHRKALEGRKDGVPVQLEAGYGDSPPLLFRGILDTATSERERADWVTTIYSDDGRDALKARAQVSYRGGVSVQKVLSDLADQLDVGLGNVKRIISQSGSSISELGSALAHGFAAKGGVADAFFDMLRDAGVDASIQDGEIQATQAGAAVSGESVLLRRDTGLVGTPAVDRTGRLEAQALLIDGLRPGYAVQVESTTASGTWKIDSVIYTGDTYRDEWYAQIEGGPLS